MSNRLTSTAIVVGIATAIGSASATASEPADTGPAAWNFQHVVISKADTPAVESPLTASAGMRAFKDKETGRLRNPTAQEMEELAAEESAAPTAAPAAITVRTLTNGMKVATLDESFLTYSVATKSASGRVTTDCVENSHQADAAIHAAPAQEVADDR